MEHGRRKQFRCSLASVSCIASLPLKRKSGITYDWLVKPKKKVRFGRPRFRSGAIPLSTQRRILREYYAGLKTERLTKNKLGRIRNALAGRCILCGKYADLKSKTGNCLKYCSICRTKQYWKRLKKAFDKSKITK
jgi:hypothetical protein